MGRGCPDERVSLNEVTHSQSLQHSRRGEAYRIQVYFYRMQDMWYRIQINLEQLELIWFETSGSAKAQ